MVPATREEPKRVISSGGKDNAIIEGVGLGNFFVKNKHSSQSRI